MECAAASAETEGADAAQETMTAPSRGAATRQQEHYQPSPPADTSWHVVAGQTARVDTGQPKATSRILIGTDEVALAGRAGLQ
jgi:hypothetical protein